MGCFPVLPQWGERTYRANCLKTSTARGVGESRENKTGISKKGLTASTEYAIIRVSRGDGNHFRFAVVQVNEVEKNVKNPLTTSTKCAIISTQGKES